MAATRTVKEPTPRSDTHQMLDELDALMDRMLALPIEEPEEQAAAPAPTVSATLTLLDPPQPENPSEPLVAEERSADNAAPDMEPVAPMVPTPPMAEDDPVAVPVINDVAAPARFDIVSPARVVAASRWRPDQISYQFLLWVNQSYDHGTHWLGSPGGFLRSRRGRTCLGIAGMGLLALALAWLGKDWLGWNW